MTTVDAVADLGKSDPFPYTVADLVSHVLATFDLAPTTRDERIALRAAREAIRQVVNRHAWRGNSRRQRTYLHGPYSTGTVSVSGRTVTLSGGSFPSWAKNGVITFTGDTNISDSRGWRVLRQESGTELILDSELPTSLSGVSYKLSQNALLLSSQLRQIRGIYEATRDQPIALLDPSDFHTQQLWDDATPADIRAATVATDYEVGRQYLLVSPPPDQDTVLTIDGLYNPMPATRMIRSGSGQYVDVSGTTATFTGVEVPTGLGDMALMVSEDRGSAPTPVGGWGHEAISDPAQQFFVASRTSSTAVELSKASTYAEAGFILSDIIDMGEYARPALERFAEAGYARMTMRRDWPRWEEMANQELLYAMEQEMPLTPSPSPSRGLCLRTGHIVSEDA